jgi:hypothetical protein
MSRSEPSMDQLRRTATWRERNVRSFGGRPWGPAGSATQLQVGVSSSRRRRAGSWVSPTPTPLLPATSRVFSLACACGYSIRHRERACSALFVAFYASSKSDRVFLLPTEKGDTVPYIERVKSSDLQTRRSPFGSTPICLRTAASGGTRRQCCCVGSISADLGRRPARENLLLIHARCSP